MHMFCLQPRAQPGIVDLRLILPEIGTQPALNLQMIQLQFDDCDASGEVSPDIRGSNMQSGNAKADGMCSDYHPGYLPFCEG